MVESRQPLCSLSPIPGSLAHHDDGARYGRLMVVTAKPYLHTIATRPACADCDTSVTVTQVQNLDIPPFCNLDQGHDGSESEKDGSGTDTEKPRRILRGFLMLIELSSRLLALVTSLTQQFAVLLLAHPLAALLDDRTHREPPFLVIVKIATCPIVHCFGDFA